MSKWIDWNVRRPQRQDEITINYAQLQISVS